MALLGCHHERPSGREGPALSPIRRSRRRQKQIPRFARNDNFRGDVVLRVGRGPPVFSCRIKLALSYLAWIHLSSETSRSSPILIMGRVRLPTACSSLPARCPHG